MSRILQLRQEQLLGVPFALFKELVDPKTNQSMVKVEGDYVIVPTTLVIQTEHPSVELTNILLRMAVAAGFTYLMLKYV